MYAVAAATVLFLIESVKSNMEPLYAAQGSLQGLSGHVLEPYEQ